MSLPQITFGYLAALAGLFSVLSVIVVGLRARYDIPFGDGGNPTLMRAIRIHGNFAEWVPLVVLVVGGLEVVGGAPQHIHMLMGILLAARILHPIGLFSPVRSLPYMVGRVSGAFSTWLVLSVAALMLATQL